MKEILHPRDYISARQLQPGGLSEDCLAHGFFTYRHTDKYGNLIDEGGFKNTVDTEGKNLALDTFLAGSAYTVTGPFMGLISSVSFSAVAATDVAAQINGTNGWKEAGSGSNFPLYQVSGSAVRATCAWSAASAGSKSLSAALSFVCVTTGGTVKGAFIIFGSGALNTIANTGGKLWSAGLFTGGDQVMATGNTLQVSYTTGM